MSKSNALALLGSLDAASTQKKNEPVFVKYNVNPDAPGSNPQIQQRVIKMVEEQVDPLEPSKFKNKKAPREAGSTPPPVMHSPNRKLTAEDQKNWKIPPCVSNWKNQKGYTIPLDKRIQADGRNYKDHSVSEKFASFNESLFIAQRQAREEIKIRNEIEMQKKLLEEKEKEEVLRSKAKELRQEKHALHQKNTSTAILPGETTEDYENRMKKLEIEKLRQRQIENDYRLEAAGRKFKRRRNDDDDRDISETVTLGHQ